MAPLLPKLLKGPVLNWYGTSKNQYGTSKRLVLDQCRTSAQPVGLVWDQYDTSRGPVLDQYWINIGPVQGSMGPVETKTSKYRIFVGLVLEHYGQCRQIQASTNQYEPVQNSTNQYRTSTGQYTPV